jgi:hypothetical protein
MKEKDLFKLAVRILGLVFLYHAIAGVPPALESMLIFLRRWRWEMFVSAFGAVLWCAWMLVLAYFFVRGAALVAEIAYGNEDKTFQPEPPAAAEKSERS